MALTLEERRKLVKIGKHCICKMYAEYINLYSTCGLAEEMSGEEKVSQPATSSCGNVSTV